MKEEKYRKGQVVFRQGDLGDCMYFIRWGSVGVFANYGEKNEKKLAELRAGDYFGEMELLDHASRSATVVSLERGTVLSRISEDEFDEFVRENPARIADILARLSHKLRETTKKYLQVCQAVDQSVGAQADEVVESETYGFEQNKELRAIHDMQDAVDAE